MRSALSLTMCASLAIAAATEFAAPDRAAAADLFLKLSNVDGNPVADQHKETIEISSWQWGATRAQGKVEHEWKVEEGESAPPQPGTAKYGAVSGMHRDDSVGRPQAAGRGIDIARVDGEIVAPSSTAGKRPTTRPMGLAPGSSRPRPAASEEKGGTEDINIGVGELQESPRGDPDRPIIAGSVPNPSDAASGQATGKRQHKPIRARAYNDASAGGTAQFNPKEIAVTKDVPWQRVSQPLDRGAVRVKVKFPWVGCRVGARYPALTLGGGAQRYELTDAVVTHCGAASSGGESLPMEEVSFNYGKVTVRGWDPATKQQ